MNNLKDRLSIEVSFLKRYYLQQTVLAINSRALNSIRLGFKCNFTELAARALITQSSSKPNTVTSFNDTLSHTKRFRGDIQNF